MLRSRDHLYLEAGIKSAQSLTGFKVSILRGTLSFQLSRSYVAQKIEVEMVGFKSVRISEKGNVNMGAGIEVRDMAERLCCITWNLGENVELEGGQEYHYEFSALLDARLPRSIKAGSSKIYYRLSADIPNLRSLKTETGLTIPWSRSSKMAADLSDQAYEASTIQIDSVGQFTMQIPRTIIKGPNRYMIIKLYPEHASPTDLHATHVDIEVLQNVALYLERLSEAHEEPSVVVQKVHENIPPGCSAESPLDIRVPLPAVIHPEMHNTHISVSHVLRVTIHRAGMRSRKVHKQKIVLHYLDQDLRQEAELPMYDDIMSNEHNDPVYEYNATARRFSEVQQNVL